VRAKKRWRQEDLAEFLGVDPSTVSKMGQGWELHWQCFLKLLPYFMEYDVLTERNLHGHQQHEPIANQSGNKTVKAKASHL
jgi:hypothetical protein